MDHHAEHLDAVRLAVLSSPGSTRPDLREAAFWESGVGPRWTEYVAKVREASQDIDDTDVDRLRALGCSEEAILEMTLATALGAAAHRLDVGLRALREAD